MTHDVNVKITQNKELIELYRIRAIKQNQLNGERMTVNEITLPSEPTLDEVATFLSISKSKGADYALVERNYELL